MRTQLISDGVIGDDAYVVVAGPANTYGHYVATREEYTVQRYEGASTLFGPCMLSSLTLFPRGRFHVRCCIDYPHLVTLEAYINKCTSLVPFLAENASGTPSSDAAPAEQTSKAISLQV